MFAKILPAPIIVLCSATTVYVANIAPAAAYQTGGNGHSAGGGGGADRG
jgi:hypothetical protein